MATCKDCFHFDVCKVLRYGDISDCNSDYCGGFFKPKADVVKVVRCKDCKYVSLYCGSYSCYNSQTPWFNDEFNINVGADDFCSYGELKECDGK